MFGIPVNPEDLPEGLRQVVRQQQAAQEHRQMVNEDIQNRIFGFIEELSLEDKSNLLLVLTICEDDSMIHYFEGYLSHALRAKGVCAGCGQSHDPLAEHGISSVQEMNTPNSVVTEHDDDPDSPPLPVAEVELDSVQETEQVDALFDLYEVEEVGSNGRLGCKNCHVHVWPNLADRMMAEPGKPGCPSCIEKEKWG